MILRVINRRDPLRPDVEAYVRRVFASQHAAIIREFPERLAAALGPDLTPLCAAGFRTAEDGFFSENYLRAPIESVIGHACRAPVRRDQIIEVTSLASDRPGHAFTLLDFITRLGRADGRNWGVFTATEKIRRCFERAGLSFLTLAPARVEAVPNPGDWGRYYEAQPAVCAMQDRRECPVSFQPLQNQPIVFGGVPAMDVKYLG